MDCEESACFRRESELAELERRCVSRRFEFGVIYGTRRIGKTTMLQEFIIKEKNAFIFRRAKQMKKTISSLSAANISTSGEWKHMPSTAPHDSRAKRATLYKESAMLRKAYTPASMFFEAFTLLVVGILFFTNPEGTLIFVVSIIHILAWITAINNLFHWLTKRDEHRPSLFHALLMLGFAVFLTIHPVFIVSSASLVFQFGFSSMRLQNISTLVNCGKRKAGEKAERCCRECCIHYLQLPFFLILPEARFPSVGC